MELTFVIVCSSMNLYQLLPNTMQMSVLTGVSELAQRIKQNVVQVTELHRQLGRFIRKVALSNDHFVVEKGGLPVAVMMSMKEYERLVTDWKVKEFQRLARTLGEEAERQGLTEEKLMEELEVDKRAVFKEMYGKSKS